MQHITVAVFEQSWRDAEIRREVMGIMAEEALMATDREVSIADVRWLKDEPRKVIITRPVEYLAAMDALIGAGYTILAAEGSEIVYTD